MYIVNLFPQVFFVLYLIGTKPAGPKREIKKKHKQNFIPNSVRLMKESKFLATLDLLKYIIHVFNTAADSFVIRTEFNFFEI
jgi:hypothetical protein